MGSASDLSDLPDLSRAAVDVAPLLLGAVLHKGSAAGQIVEVEAYGAEDDAASHAANGETPRNQSMFGAPGTLYVYLIYGIHLCVNVVCGPVGVGGAVLIRALAPLSGEEEMWVRRPKARTGVDLCSGPGKLTQALGIVRDDDGVDLLSSTHPSVRLSAGVPASETEPPAEVRCGPRIGISKAAERPWRFALAESPFVSRPVPTAAFGVARR
jgi:DNA-3-methyladenine glycosylase